MISSSHLPQLASLFGIYNETIKPLLAYVESRYEAFPDAILNEIRAYNDHIARCFTKNTPNGSIPEELSKAQGHLKRIVFDCFKYLIVSLHDEVKRFERRTKNIDITSISNGEFYIKYKKLFNEATQAVRKAKLIESTNHEEAFGLFQEAFNIYSELEELIQNNTTNINWARTKFTVKTTSKLLLFLFAAIISGFISYLFGILPYVDLFKSFKGLF